MRRIRLTTRRTTTRASFLASLPICFLVGSNAVAQVNTDTDWATRSTGPGVVYAEGFEFPSKSDLLAASDGHTDKPPANSIDLDTSVVLSGSKSLKLITYTDAAANGGSWANKLDGGAGKKFTRFYIQFAVYLPRETIGYRTKGGDGQLKLVNIEQYGAGQVVIGNKKFLGFPSMLINGTGTFDKTIQENSVPKVSQEYIYQPAVDTGTPASPSDACEFWSRYGPSRGVAVNDDYGDTNPEPYLYKRNLTYGWPNRCALKSGVPFNIDGWTVVEVFIDYNVSDSKSSTVRAWAAPFGQSPRIFIDERGTMPLASNDSIYSRFELLNYDTARSSETNRPTMYTYFDDVIVSTEPIPFPGGHALTDAATPPTTPLEPITSPSATAAPSWVQNIEPGTWKAISSNSLKDVDPEDDPDANPNYPNSAPWHGNTGQPSVLRVWNGGAFASGLGRFGSLLVFGGGHSAYYGSEVYAFDLETTRWKRLTNPYAGPFNWPYATAAYPDGSPVPPHTYDVVDYDPVSNSFMVLSGRTDGRAAGNDPGVPLAVCHALDLRTMQWRESPISEGTKLYSGGYSAYDSRRGVFWLEGGSSSSNFLQFDPAQSNSDGSFGKWQTYDRKLTMTDSVAAYDPIHDIVVVTAFRNDSVLYAIDPSNPTGGKVRLTEGGTPPNKRSSAGWEWSAVRQAFLYWRDGDGVYEFKLDGSDWKTGTWVWSRLTAASNNVTPQPMDVDNGIYSRFRIATFDDSEVALVVNNVGGPVYAFRIPGSFIRPKEPTGILVE